ncbi:MAG TPA: dihydrofolate reductase family protein, partial [Nocardioidaceae bacterium]|nr:dihydrofolate reductase family protein [Nocardioidaceae bacterium]
MGRLIYSAIASLDGYTTDADGRFDWSAPDEEVHGFINDLERSVGTYLYGRRMYETMAVWETDPELAEGSAVTGDYAQVWRAADKIVYSTTLQSAETERTRIEQSFDADAVRRLKESTDADLSIGGPTLAADAIRAGLVDEWHLFVTPIIVG